MPKPARSGAEPLSPSEMTLADVLRNFPSPTFRKYQKDAMSHAVDAFSSGKKCIMLSAPVGFGKTYLAAAFATLTSSFYTTPQLALIDQMLRDPYLEDKFVEIKGHQNYRCYYLPEQNVHVGKCVTEHYPCRERFEVCPYWKQKLKAVNSPCVLMSSAYLMSEGQAEGQAETRFGSRELLVLDESHNIEEQALNHVSLRVTPYTIPRRIFKTLHSDMVMISNEKQLEEYLRLLEEYLLRLLKHEEQASRERGLTVAQAEEKMTIERFLTNYEMYTTTKDKTEWVWQVGENQLNLQPVFARAFMKQLIWKRAPYYIISSATILDPEYYTELIGLWDVLKEDEVAYIQVPSTFPVENRPVIDSTVGPLSMSGWAQNMPKAISMVARILEKEKGNCAVHCHSYRHQRALVEGLPKSLRPRLIVHSSVDRAEKLAEWMQSRGKVFVSVAFNEGQDWKYDICDCQILLKVPFADLSDKRVKRRLELGQRQWYDNQAMLETIQAYGRAIRAEDDKARFYVIDGSFKWLVKNCWKYIPDWFKEALPATFVPPKTTSL